MTNPGNAIGTNGAFGGRTSVNAFNDDLALYVSRGILSGFAVSPDSGMKVVVGGDGTTRDVAIAEDNIGNKTTINNISGSPVQLTISGAPASNSRIDAIVAYVDNPAQGSATQTDNFGACGLIVVEGTVAGTPSKPNESAIRSAITTDGASGTTAYFVVLGYVSVANGTTDITSNMIEQGSNVVLNADNIGDGTLTQDKLSNSFLSDLAFLPGDTLQTGGDFLCALTGVANRVYVTIPFDKSLGLISSITITTGNSAGDSYGFFATSSGVLSYSPAVKPNQTATSSPTGGVGVRFAFETNGTIPGSIWANGLMRMNNLRVVFN